MILLRPIVDSSNYMTAKVPYVTIWSLWLHRNDIVYKQKKADAVQLFDVIRLGLAHWSKTEWPQCLMWLLLLLISLLTLPQFLSRFKNSKCNLLNNVSWTCPPPGYMKLNVDGSVTGKPGPTAIGGIFRDHFGDIKKHSLFSLVFKILILLSSWLLRKVWFFSLKKEEGRYGFLLFIFIGFFSLLYYRKWLE